MVNRVAANVLGTMGTVCWTGQIIPQIWKSWREKSTKGFSPWLMLLWGFASVFMGAYAFIKKLNVPLTLQPQLFGFLCLTSWGQCQYYEMKRSARTATLITCGVMIACGLVELLLVLTIRPMQNARHKEIAASFFGIAGAVLISAALFPQYYEIYKLKAVIGISLVFISIDMLGGLLNDLSLAFGDDFDVIAAVAYTLVLDGIILVCAAAFKILGWKRGRAIAKQGRTVGEAATSGGVDEEAASGMPLERLTILSRGMSRLSNTPSEYSCTATDDPVSRAPSAGGERNEVEEQGEKLETKSSRHSDANPSTV